MKAITLDGAPAARADYGIDAPGVIRVLLIVTILTAGLALAIARVRWLAWMSAFCAVEAAWMLWASRVGKLRQRDVMLDALQLRGNERVVDVGCGRGLLLIGAAHRLTSGRAIGVDLWSQTDLSSNSMQATLENARIEGVSDRVEVHTGDARALPLPDASVDVVVSSLAIHNIPDNAGRIQAIREAMRVLKPGGVITVQDIRHAQLYATTLRAAGMQDVRVSAPQLRIFPFSRIVTARKVAP